MRFPVAAAIPAVLLCGCVSVIRYDPLPPTAASVRSALEANASLSMDRWASMNSRVIFDDQGKVVVVERTRRDAPFQMCAKTGERIDAGAPSRVEEAAVCFADASGAETCHRYDDLQSIGRPRDSTAIGYFPVPIWMKCRPAA